MGGTQTLSAGDTVDLAVRPSDIPGLDIGRHTQLRSPHRQSSRIQGRPGIRHVEPVVEDMVPDLAPG